MSAIPAESVDGFACRNETFISCNFHDATVGRRYSGRLVCRLHCGIDERPYAYAWPHPRAWPHPTLHGHPHPCLPLPSVACGARLRRFLPPAHAAWGQAHQSSCQTSAGVEKQGGQKGQQCTLLSVMCMCRRKMHAHLCITLSEPTRSLQCLSRNAADLLRSSSAPPGRWCRARKTC